MEGNQPASSAEPAQIAQALSQFLELRQGAEALAMLRGAGHAGLLDLLSVSCHSEALSAQLGVPASRVEAALGLLDAYGIVDHHDQTWSLAPGWRELALERTPTPFAGLLAMNQVRVQQIEQCLGGSTDYWTLGAEDRLAVALAASPNPDAAQEVVRADITQLEGVIDALSNGGRVLELGCGVGSRITALLLAFPAAEAVGIELAEDLVRYGRERATQLGIADRITFIVGDASTCQPQGSFDLVGWSQFFFPDHSRSATLCTARRVLRPGGWITCPVLWDGTIMERNSTAHRRLAVDRLMLDLWGVPLKSTQSVADELAAAGFVDLKIHRNPANWLVRGRQPQTPARAP